MMWEKIKTWFKDSETIFWARFQVVAGVAFAVLPTLNPVSWLDESLSTKQRLVMAGVAIANGLWSEYLRRRRADDL